MRKKNIMRVLLIIIVVVFAYDMYASGMKSDMSVVDGNNGEEVKSHEEITKDMNNKEKVDYYEKVVRELEGKVDTLANDLKTKGDTIGLFRNEIDSLKKEVAFKNDTIASYKVKEMVLKDLSNEERINIGLKCTLVAYESAMVAYAIELCRTANNLEKKNLLEKTSDMLGDYKKSNEELIGILERIKEINIPFNFEKNTKRLIEEMEYYKKYYKKEWHIQYLDEIIATALNRIETKGTKAKYDDLINKLMGE